MVWKEKENYWDDFVGEVKKRWSQLTDDDLEECKDSRNVLVTKLKDLYGMTDQEAGEKVKEMEMRIKQASEGGQRQYGGNER